MDIVAKDNMDISRQITFGVSDITLWDVASFDISDEGEDKDEWM